MIASSTVSVKLYIIIYNIINCLKEKKFVIKINKTYPFFKMQSRFILLVFISLQLELLDYTKDLNKSSPLTIFGWFYIKILLTLENIIGFRWSLLPHHDYNIPKRCYINMKTKHIHTQYKWKINLKSSYRYIYVHIIYIFTRYILCY